ncbi:DUF2515 domain-containing protein [Bacillus sp. ISL-40]|uniref:DUF2515 domain-containing protein n=1 Tax=unclassified Bacillus (in: firmicutes) TaxID=185979 RepID=UPI001BE72620|nr:MULTISPECIES: DUF2515 domain-containing protein [unclassified Bacillus (in: firmicutes)]MBT2699698.1 DUF2515 domain-containing protein [Bacillus sp. ISL-40]MBT2744318.1 DUF2515 domain-containing protein [Bacillus sp. ISL-77]
MKGKQSGLPPKITRGEAILLEQIKTETKEHNLNNVTRTKAYLDFYLHFPEIHWAFLGHMVSRNGGWNMTDLKGEFLTRLLSKKERETFFAFLERGNWLIFQDVYPQFLLYRESLKQHKPLFHLSSYLNISTFMETIWNHFWLYQETYTLAIALIINEQSYLEKRVVQNPLYQKGVLNKFEFILQDLLSFNHILFPYGKRNLAGQTLHQFESLNERILLGKRLYDVLFKNKERLKLVLEWAKTHPHSGSRKDYWPHIFNNINEGIPGFAYQTRLKACQLRPRARKIYSPALEYAWKNVSQTEAEKGDWFEDDRVVDYLMDDNEKIDGEIKNEYCKTLERLELAAIAKKAISILD